jgi:protein-disulfide isomerase
MVVGVVALFAAWGQLPLLLTQAQDRSTVAELVTQTSVLPNPLTSTLTLNGVLPHEKSATLKPAEALPGRANRAAAKAMQALRERQAAEAAAKTAQALKEHRDELLADPMSPVVGDPNGKVTVVEFFDYNCPYCRAAGPMVTELLQKKPDVRFVYKEFQTLAASSRFAAQAALAARRQSPELYTVFHDGLMKATGRLAEDGVVQIAREAGVDVDRMRADMEDPGINKSIDGNIELARAIGVTGTPTFIIGDAILVGAKPLQQMESAIADARPPSVPTPAR